MFRRFHEKRKNDEGFTLIELLVVILIIAILAAIAIPVFLNQRRKGWISQSESALKNAATSMESYATGNNGSYVGATEDILKNSEGFRDVGGVDLQVGTVSASNYCLIADHDQDIPNYYYQGSTGRPQTAPTCT